MGYIGATILLAGAIILVITLGAGDTVGNIAILVVSVFFFVTLFLVIGTIYDKLKR